MNKFHAYRTIGAHRHMDDEEIRDVYRRVIRDKHPDRGGDPTEFMVIAEAYALIKSLPLRNKLDAYYALTGHVCPLCSGDGVRRRGKRFSEVILTACTRCGGSGHVREKE